MLCMVAAEALLHVSPPCCPPCPMGGAVLSQAVSPLPADVLDAPPWPGIWFSLERACSPKSSFEIRRQPSCLHGKTS